MLTNKEAIKALRDIAKYYSYITPNDKLTALKMAIEALSAADAAEVVRCKDCKHWFPHTQCGFDEDNDEYHDYCGLLVPDDDYYAYTRKPDDYCSYGERREEEEER